MDNLSNAESTLWSVQMKGEAIGEKKANLANAKSMKALSIDISIIAQVTGLATEELDKL